MLCVFLCLDLMLPWEIVVGTLPAIIYSLHPVAAQYLMLTHALVTSWPWFSCHINLQSMSRYVLMFKMSIVFKMTIMNKHTFLRSFFCSQKCYFFMEAGENSLQNFSNYWLCKRLYSRESIMGLLLFHNSCCGLRLSETKSCCLLNSTAVLIWGTLLSIIAHV